MHLRRLGVCAHMPICSIPLAKTASEVVPQQGNVVSVVKFKRVTRPCSVEAREMWMAMPNYVRTRQHNDLIITKTHPIEAEAERVCRVMRVRKHAFRSAITWPG